jgi:[ribosomal protein S5]-alanine N-acetyltransferase
MEILFDGVILRPWSIDDAAELAVIANNKNIADNLQDLFPFPYSLKDARKWLKTILPVDPPRNFAIVYDRTIVGNIGLLTKEDIHRKNIETGYFLSEKYWGLGIAPRAIKAVTSYAFSNFDIVRVYAETFADNIRSGRALEKAGFTLEATLRMHIIKNGIMKDSCIYSVLKDDFKYFLINEH